MNEPRSDGTGAPTPPTASARSPVLYSFAFRLGAAFAMIAIMGAAATAVVVNAAFTSRFNRFLTQQQSTQLTAVSTALSRSYAGNGKWDQRTLQALVPTLGTGTLQVVSPGGEQVWGWDGHSLESNDRWMDHSSQTSGRQSTTQQRTQSDDSGNQTGDHSYQQQPTPTPTPSSNWEDHDSSQWRQQMGYPAERVSIQSAVLVAATLSPTPSPTATSTLGPVQRISIEVNGKVVGSALVRLPQVSAMPEAIAFRSQVIRLVLLGGLVGSMLALGLGIFFARRATRPVREVTGAARALAAGDRSVRLAARRTDEFGEMGRAFNSMADAVDGEEQLRKGFAAEVAHELRTPLTILRSQVEGLRVGVLKPTPEALTSLDEEVRRMSRLVADLQILGSADAAGFSLERTPTALRELIDQAVREFSGLFEGSEVRLETRLEPADAWVDRVRIGQVLANLLSNALKFTPARGLVRVAVTSEVPWAVIRVSDSGPGIAADELPHVFDRFFRGRTARPSGSGIGLTVVRELVDAHGGTVEATSEPGTGATFTVRLPLQASPSSNGNSTKLRSTANA